MEVKSCDEETKTVPTNFNEKNATSKIQNFSILIAIALLMAVIFTVIFIFTDKI